MTKFVLLTEFYPPDIGGIQSTLEPIVRGLEGYITVVAPQVQPSDTTVRRSLFSGRHWPRWWWLVGWLRQARQQGMKTAIFGHFSAAVLAAYIARVPYVVLVHGNDVLFEQRRVYMRSLIGMLLRKAIWVGVNSAFMRQLVQSYGLPLARIIDSHPFVPERRVLRAPRQPRFGHTIVTVARLVKRKNITALLEVLTHVRALYPDCVLECIGDGPERASLHQRAKELGVADAVRFRGLVSEDEKWQMLESADVFVLVPTVERQGSDIEGFGIAYCEAAAVGLPVIGSDTGGIRDAVVDGQTGVLLDPLDGRRLAEEIIRMFKQSDRAQRLGEQGRQRVFREYTDTVRVQRVRQLLMNEKHPLLSVVIPAYQAATTIPATLESLERQSYRNVEIIVVDDGSSDDLPRALAPYMKHIQLIRQDNAGAPRARNVGFQRSTGEYVLFLDADTTLVSSALTTMISTLQAHPEADFVYSDFIFGWKTFHLHEFSHVSLRQMNYIHTSSMLRRSAFPGFDEHLKRFQDWDLWLTMAERGHRGLWIPQRLLRIQQRRRGIGMSTWLPSFIYRLPLIGSGRGSTTVAKYREAERIIRQKHHT